MIATLGFAMLLILGAGWGVLTLTIYAYLWGPYVQSYRTAAGMGDPMLLGGQVSVGAATFHCAAIVMMMAPWAMLAGSSFVRFVAMVDDHFAYALNGGSNLKRTSRPRTAGSRGSYEVRNP